MCVYQWTPLVSLGQLGSLISASSLWRGVPDSKGWAVSVRSALGSSTAREAAKSDRARGNGLSLCTSTRTRSAWSVERGRAVEFTILVVDWAGGMAFRVVASASAAPAVAIIMRMESESPVTPVVPPSVWL